MNDFIIHSETITRDGIDFRFVLTFDVDTRPDRDADCYSPEDIAAWRNDEWHYVDIAVTPVIGGVEIDSATAYLGGVEYGYLAGAYITSETIIARLDDPNDQLFKDALENLRAGEAAEIIAAPAPFTGDQGDTDG